MRPWLALALFAALLTDCCPGPFCEGGPGMCSGLEGRYSLTTDDREGDCGDIPEETGLVVTDQRPGYALEASWLSDCVLQAATPGSCQYEASCSALVSGKKRPLHMSVTRNGSGFYGPAEADTCKLELDTGAP